ncbi:MAG: sigma-70 family RNA polymerase sigma factor [Candidatus Poribacteria bacterium]|nr:sigma-70 family RNA polymerase sigma factor [Candidatus Poribacteria bacterium]
MKHNDTELIRRTLTGDDDAFSTLVEKYQKQVHALAWRIIGDFHIAEEITQDSFLKAYTGLKTLKEPQRFAGWMSVITRRRCLAWLRKKRVWTESYEHLEESDSEQIEETVYSAYVVEERERTSAETQRYVVKKLLAKLQESERTVMTLHYFGEMTCAEIGEFLGVSANTIKSRLHRAQQRLRKEEPIIREALDNFKITPNLTENIMREISQTKPAAPSASKPFVPWLFAASTVVVVLLMLGFGNSKYLTHFQQPYSFDANSKIKIDIIEAPVMANLALKSDERRQLGSANAQSENLVHKQKPNDTQISAQAGEENKMENYPQWNLPKEAKVRYGKGGMRKIQFSPDGKQLVVGSSIGVWVYDVETGKEISFLSGMSGAMAYSSDGRFIATGGGDPITSFGGSPLEKGVKVWNIDAGHEVSLQNALPAAVLLRFSNDSKTLVCLSKSRETIYRVDVETGETTSTNMDKRPGRMHQESYALTEEKIAIASGDGKIELWDTTTSKKLSTLREFGKEFRLPHYITRTNHALMLKFSPDGTRLATGNLDTTVELWDTSTGEELIVLQKPIEKSNTWIVSMQDNKEIVMNPTKNERNGRPSTLAFSPDGKLLACGSNDSTIKLWNSDTGELLATFTGHLSNVGSLSFSPDSNMLASGSADGTVRLWDIKSRKALNTQIAGHMWMRTASFLKDSSKLVSVSDTGIISVWDLEKSEKTTSITKAMLEEPLYWRTYRTFVLSPDGTKLGNHGTQSDPSKPNYNRTVLRLTDVNTGKDLETIHYPYLEIFSPDGKTIASGGGNKIRLLDIETGEKREIITSEHDEDSDEHKPHIRTVAFSPDGETIISGTSGGHVQLWDVNTGMELSSFFQEIPPKDNRYREPIQQFAFSSDSSLIAVGSTKRIRMIGRAKIPHFKEIAKGDKSFSHTSIFSPDNTILIVGFWGGNIELWDVNTGEILTTLNGHSVSVQNLSFSPDNKTLISVGGGTILFWDWEEVLSSARGKDQERGSKVGLSTEEQTTENVIQFLEHSTQKPKISNHILTKGEVYLANEWYDAAYEEFTKYFSAADYYREDQNVTTHPGFHRQLFAKIGKVGKDVQGKEGFADMVNKLIDFFPDSQSIQLNGHLVLAKFYHDNDMLEKTDEHIHKINDITENLPTESISFQLNACLSLVEYYRYKEMFNKADAYIQKIDDITAELDTNSPESLALQLDTHFALAEFYRDHDMLEKADEHIKKTGFVTEDAWMVLGPFDNAGGIGYNTVYIPEDITEIDLTTKYDGLDGLVSWKKFTDDKLDGYIHLGEKNVDWQVSYAFATVISPDEREVQFRFDSDDQGKVWLNGEEVFTHTKTFMAIIDTYTIPVTLKPGKNSILVKVCNEQGACAFYMRITDPNGQPFDDLKFGQ